MNLYLLLLIPLAFFCNAAYNLYRLNYFYDAYILWLVTGKNSAVLIEGKSELKSLISSSGAIVPILPDAQPIGYMQIVTYKFNVLDQFPSNRRDVCTLTIQSILEAKGIYKHRLWQSINPFYWIKTVLFLPKIILEYLGAKPENIVSKIFQLFWWAFGLSVSLYPEYFRDLLSFLAKHIPR